MKSSIYISAEQIHLIGYLGNKINGYKTYTLSEGTIYNGTIMDSSFLTECLTSMKKDYPDYFKKEVSLTVDGSSILSRRLVTPKLSKRQYLQLVRDEFADVVPDTNNLVCEYRNLQSAQNSILAYAVEKNQLDMYIATFKEAGIKLHSINIGAELILNHASTIKKLQEGTKVLSIIDGLMMLSMLFVNGENVYMTRTRLYGDDNAQIQLSVMANLNGLIQFAQSQNHGVITESYYLGMSDSDAYFLQENNPYPDIEVEGITLGSPRDGVPNNAHFAMLSTMYGAKSINLLTARKALDKYVKSRKPKKIWIPLVAIYFVSITAVAIFLLVQWLQVTRNINEINDFLESEYVVSRSYEIETVQNVIARYNAVMAQVESKNRWIETLPGATSSLINFVIYDHGQNVTITNFIFNEGREMINVSGNTPDASFITDYINALNQSDLVSSAWHQGFTSGPNNSSNFSAEIIINIPELETEENGEEATNGEGE